MTTPALQTKLWEHISLEHRKQFRKDLTEHTFRAGLPFWPPFPRGMVPECVGPPYRVAPAWELWAARLFRRLLEIVRSMMAPQLMHFQA